MKRAQDMKAIGLFVIAALVGTFIISNILGRCSSAKAADQPADLVTCESHPDCILVSGPCGSPVAVNKKYGDREKKEPDSPLMLPVIMCLNGVAGWPSGAVAKCVKSECQVVVKDEVKKRVKDAAKTKPETSQTP